MALIPFLNVVVCCQLGWLGGRLVATWLAWWQFGGSLVGLVAVCRQFGWLSGSFLVRYLAGHSEA